MDLNKVKQAATKEFEDEKLETAKKKYKTKLLELDHAKKVVSNIEREIQDLEDELSAT